MSSTMLKEPLTAPLSRTSSFIKQYPELDPSNHLRILEQHARECGGVGSGQHSPSLHERFTSIISPSHTPPLSPADSYAGLYPEPPHLSRPSSPRRSSFFPSSTTGGPTTGSTGVGPSGGAASPPLLSKRPSMIEDEHGHHKLPTTQLMGKLSIIVVEAKGLMIETGKEKPYVLLQYDRTDSVGREYGAPPPNSVPPRGENKKRGGGLKRLNARAPQGLDGKGQVSVRRVGQADVKAASGPALDDSNSNVGASSLKPPKMSRRSTTEMSTSTRIVDDSPPIGDPKDIGTPDSPIWNHQASFDVISPGRTILICVYDKLAPQGGFPAHGFMGASVFEAPLSAETGEDGNGLDIWVPLTSALDLTVGGEVRLRILFENLHARPKLCVDDFQVLRRIGQGSFGQVFRVRKRDTKRIYAMKVISKKNVVSPETLAQVLAERQVLARTLESPFLVGLKFSFQSPTDLFFVIDYKSGGELFQHLQRDGGRFEEGKTRFYVAEIVLGLAHLHSQNIVYRDLKPENCLLDGSGHVILCDFGLSKLLDSPDATTNTLCGTTAFTAPEVLLDEGYSFTCDLWSLGCLAYEMCYGFSPFYAESRIEEYERILSGEIKIPVKKGYSSEGRDLLQRLLTREPEQRITTEQIQRHLFFESIDWKKLALRQISPPFKPPTHADEDACDYHDLGKSGHWMFDEMGGCHSTRGSMVDHHHPGGGASTDEDVDGLFRNFTFTAKEKETRLQGGMTGAAASSEFGMRKVVTERINGTKERKVIGSEARRSSFNLMP